LILGYGGIGESDMHAAVRLLALAVAESHT